MGRQEIAKDFSLAVTVLDQAAQTVESRKTRHNAKVALSNLAQAYPTRPSWLPELEFELLQSHKNSRPLLTNAAHKMIIG